MKISSSVFVSSAPNLSFCPPSDLLEFAFIGRSNVGKSSLINMLAGRKDLAKVSATPGKTKLINFFLINDSWCLVDLPGYGYAKVAKKDRVDFNESVADYLEQRSNLSFIFLLIDSRLPPQAIDLDFLQWVGERSLPFGLIFTKTDKLSASKAQANIEVFLQRLDGFLEERPQTFTSSSSTRSGRSEILNFIGQRIAQC
jgi:GTP-binding protein